MQSLITVQTTVKASPSTCWKIWTNPSDILAFNSPFDDWHTARVEIDLKEGGRLYYRMEAKHGSEGFDFAGTYDTVIVNQKIVSTGDDGRKTTTLFEASGNDTLLTEIFEPDATTPPDIQRNFCQNLLDNFKKYIETKIG